jgi:hypothetical protein
VAGADLDHVTFQPGKQLATVFVLFVGGRPHVEAGEQRVVNLLGNLSHTPITYII